MHPQPPSTPHFCLAAPPSGRICPLLGAALLLLIVTGCTIGPSIIPAAQRRTVDRALVEYPPGFELHVLAKGLTAPTCIAFDYDDPVHKGSMFIAESGQ